MSIHTGVDLTIYSSFQWKWNAYFTRTYILNKKVFCHSLWKSSGGSKRCAKPGVGAVGSVSTQVILSLFIYSCVDCSKMKFALLKKNMLTSFPYVNSFYLLEWGRVSFAFITNGFQCGKSDHYPTAAWSGCTNHSLLSLIQIYSNCLEFCSVLKDI